MACGEVGGRVTPGRREGFARLRRDSWSLARVPKSVVLEKQRPLPQRLTVTVPERINHRVTSSSKDLPSCKLNSSERTDAPGPLHYPGSRE